MHQSQMQMVLVVWNDAGYGAEVHKLMAKGFDEKLAQWESPDFVALAKAFAGDGVLLKDPSKLGGASRLRPTLPLTPAHCVGGVPPTCVRHG